MNLKKNNKEIVEAQEMDLKRVERSAKMEMSWW